MFAKSLPTDIYEDLEFQDDERAKVLILDKQMHIQKLINVKKGQKELKLNLPDSEDFYITFIENPQKTPQDIEDSKESLAQENLEEGIQNAPFQSDSNLYKMRFDRNRFLGGFLGFEPHKFNYILPANMSLKNEDGQAKRTEAKFQISLKKLIADDLLFKNLDLYVAYTQQSFWQVYDSKDSRPFRESNYEPEIFFSYPLEKYPLFFDRVNFGYVHQSNGGGSLNSRSWDRLFLQGVYTYDHFIFALKTWYRIEENGSKDDNPDILDYLGYGELSAGYVFKNHLWTLTLRNNLQSDNKGAIILDYSYPIYKNLYFYIQFFSGYGESLIDYNRSIDRIGVGLLFAR